MTTVDLPSDVLAVGTGKFDGLQIRDLTCVDVAKAVECYLAIQTDRLLPMGIAGQELHDYADYLVRHSAACGASAAAVTPEGRVIGLMMYFAGEIQPEPTLSTRCTEHRNMAITLGRNAATLIPAEERDQMIEIVFGGVIVEYRGSGLMKMLERLTATRALARGFTRTWSWTLNPIMIKTQGNTDKRVWLLTHIAEYLLMAPHWALNTTIFPALAMIGVVPSSYRVCVVKKDKFPILDAVHATTDVACAVLSFEGFSGQKHGGGALGWNIVSRNAAAAQVLQPKAKL
eukprot:TRINITY_DN1745_c8_g1_i1.p1 TRINITY_DN1745_c8_g1~~TRINITY_DN1745_c8_g1_i1.p1  ORF type:complete len:287 (+),score=85.58 TRINITY_DN1745_c8_g1_i1:71-931(+)